MGTENRKYVRFPEFGKVSCPELCGLSGILDNISATGCKIHFPVSVVVDLESEYMLRLSLSHSIDEEPLSLMCHPIWVSEKSGVTEIGFGILYSPDDARLREIISLLESSQDDFLDLR